MSLQWKRLTHKRSTTLFNPFLPFLIGNFLGDDMEREPLRPTDHFERRPLPYPLLGQQFVQIINADHRPPGEPDDQIPFRQAGSSRRAVRFEPND